MEISGDGKIMDIGVKILLYFYLFILLYITFANIYEMNKKINIDGKSKQIKIKNLSFLFFKANKEIKNIYNFKIVLLEIITYLLIFSMVVGFIISLFVKDSITLIIYAILFTLITSIGIYTGYRKK